MKDYWNGVTFVFLLIIAAVLVGWIVGMVMADVLVQ